MMAQAQGPFRQKDLWWAVPAAAPFLLIFFSYLTSSWSWGLMDDLWLVTQPGNIWERTGAFFAGYLAFGELKWTHALYCGVFYRVFADHPTGFHIFKALLIAGMLLIWGAAAFRLTGRKVMLLLVPAITLSFHYLYDQFFFLSAHEFTGLIFLGLAFWAIIEAEFPPRVPKRQMLWVGAGLAFLAALGAKETFLAGVLSTGLVCLVWGAWKGRAGKVLLIAGVTLIVLGIIQAILLKFVISSSYTSAYKLTDLPKIFSNLQSWIKKDLANHAPWIIGTAWLLFSRVGRKGSSLWTDHEKFGIALGAVTYLLFLGILLPWNTVSYYAAPFGVFFAFTVAIVLGPLLETLDPRRLALAVVAALVVNTAVCGYALKREASYHAHTQDLWDWMRQDESFQRAALEKEVCCNAPEASGAIPGWINELWGLNLPEFKYSTDTGNACEYYIYSPRFAGIDLAPLSGWRTPFTRKWWTVYRSLDYGYKNLR